DVVYVNNGTAVESVDCGAGNDTIVVNPYRQPGGVSNSQALRQGRIRDCERVIAASPVADPTRGIRWLAGDSGSTRWGSERDDTLLGGRGSDQLSGGEGDDVIWGDRNHAAGGAG